VNDAFQKRFGYAKAELYGMTVSDLTHEDDRAATLLHRNELISGKSDRASIQKRYRDRDQNVIWSKTLVSQVKDASGELKYFISQIQDITEIKNAQLSMIQSAKMVALGEMVSGLAHEINNPLTIIKGYADLIQLMVKRGSATLPEVSLQAAQISSTAIRMSKIIQALLSFSREQKELVLEPHLISDVIELALSICGERLKHNGVLIEVKNNFFDPVLCSEAAISHVMVNLLGNSLDAIKIVEKKWIVIELKAKGDEVMISVIDSGPGIPAELRNQIMLPFFTTKPPGEGTGLGLSVSQGLVQAHRGRIELNVESPHTRFDVYLPILSESH
jgi:PAS domain S-box-containing protein